MAKATKQHPHTVAIGMNIVTDDGEVRYEPGESIPVEHVEQWMIDDAHVEGPNVAEPARTAETAAEVAGASDATEDTGDTGTAETAADDEPVGAGDDLGGDSA